MTTILIAAGVVAAIIALGAYLRWATLPMLGGYEIGVKVGRLRAAKQAGADPATYRAMILQEFRRRSDTGPQLAAVDS